MKTSSVRFTDLQLATARDPKREIESAFVAAGLPMRPTTDINETWLRFGRRVYAACRRAGVQIIEERDAAARVRRFRFEPL